MDGKATVELPSVTVVRQVILKYLNVFITLI